MDRPARVQCSQSEINEKTNERNQELQHNLGGGAVYNVWHRKWAGGNTNNKRFRSPFRCNIANDTGYTRSNGPHFCLWFARGCCYKGKECAYLHRLPEDSDIAKLDGTNTVDCFGRTKFADFREDRGGIGSFLHPSKTLYIGYFKTKNKSHLLARIRQQFQEWGELESARLGKSNSIAFVKFKNQMNAEFAKEAMSNQSITGDEILLVKWAQSGDELETIPENKIREIVRNVLMKKAKNQHGTENDSSYGLADKQKAIDSTLGLQTALVPPPAKRQRPSENT